MGLFENLEAHFGLTVVIDPQLRWPTVLTYLIESPTQRQTLRATEPLPSLVPLILPPEELFEQWH